MKETIYNWLSENGTYMRIVECMQFDRSNIIHLYATDFIIALLYTIVLVYALVNYFANKDSVVAKGFLAVWACFYFCSIGGYISDILGIFAPHYKFKIVVNYLTIVFTIMLVYYLYVIDFLDDFLRIQQKSFKNQKTNEEQSV